MGAIFLIFNFFNLFLFFPIECYLCIVARTILFYDLSLTSLSNEIASHAL